MKIKITAVSPKIIVPKTGHNVPVSDAVVRGAEVLPGRFNSTSSPSFKAGIRSPVKPSADKPVKVSR